MDDRSRPGRRARAGVVRALLPSAVAALVLLVSACASGTDPGSPDDAGPSSPGTAPGVTPDPDPTPDPSASAGDGASAGATELTVVLDETGSGASVQTWTLTCDPAGGDHPDPEGACAALADALEASGLAVFAPADPNAMCTEQYGGPQVATVTGTVRGEAVDARFDRTNGCGISRWDPLAPLLGSAGGA